MTYRLGVDVGGTFTDLLLVNEKTGQTWKAKVSSTPSDQSVGVLRGIDRVCKQAGVAPKEIQHVMHGTTVATNTVLTGTGARVGLVTTTGYRQVLQRVHVGDKAADRPDKQQVGEGPEAAAFKVHSRPFAGQRAGNRPSDATRAAEHHGVSSLQAQIHTVLPLLGPRAL